MDIEKAITDIATIMERTLESAKTSAQVIKMTIGEFQDLVGPADRIDISELSTRLVDEGVIMVMDDEVYLTRFNWLANLAHDAKFEDDREDDSDPMAPYRGKVQRKPDYEDKTDPAPVPDIDNEPDDFYA